MSRMSETATQPSGDRAVEPLVAGVLSAIVGLLLVVSLVGPAWIHTAANPATGAPKADLSFQDLRQVLEGTRSTGWQDAYFGWFAWVLVPATLVLAASLWLRPRRDLGAALSVAALAGFVGSLYALKGMLTWSQFLDSAHILRAGGYFVFAGFGLALVVGVVGVIRRT